MPDSKPYMISSITSGPVCKVCAALLLAICKQALRVLKYSPTLAHAFAFYTYEAKCWAVPEMVIDYGQLFMEVTGSIGITQLGMHM